MAGFTADLNPKVTGMSLAEIMKAGAYGAEMDVLNRQAAVAREKEKEMPIIKNFMADPTNKLSDGSFDLKQMPALISIAPLTGPEYADKIIGLTKNNIETNRALNSLSEENRKPFASIYGNYGQLAANGQAVTNTEIIGSLQRLKEFYPQLAQAADGQIKSWQARPENTPIDPQTLLKSRNETLTPTQLIDQFAPKATTGEIGGQKVGIVTQPSVMGEQPKVSTAPLGGGQQPTTGMQPTTPTTPATTTTPKTRVLPDLIKEDPDFNYTGPMNPMNLNDLQRESYKNGKTMMREAPILATAAEEGKQYVRKVEEVAFKASGAGAYKTAQDWARLIVAQPDLDTLRKNIAGVMVQNANTMGLNKTDSSRGDAATISGSDAISPEALRDIMQRADAQFTATTKFAEGLKNYREKRGEVNSAINADKFQSAWANNYDSRIFQLQNIRDSNYPETVKKQRYDSITKSMSEKEFDELDKKAKAIDRLVKGTYK
jgi:hypothetical protein